MKTIEITLNQHTYKYQIKKSKKKMKIGLFFYWEPFKI